MRPSPAGAERVWRSLQVVHDPREVGAVAVARYYLTGSSLLYSTAQVRIN
jgi:hypothetical protein